MYESPIQLFYTDPIIQQINNETEDVVLRSIAKVGVVVEKDELLKALAYDRAEYERGLRDGMQIAESEIRQLHDVIKDFDIKIKRLLHKEE